MLRGGETTDKAKDDWLVKFTADARNEVSVASLWKDHSHASKSNRRKQVARVYGWRWR